MRAGRLLVAEPQMGLQPPFDQTVMLLVRHDEQFTQGVILNRPIGPIERRRVVPSLERMRSQLEQREVAEGEDRDRIDRVLAHIDSLVLATSRSGAAATSAHRRFWCSTPLPRCLAQGSCSRAQARITL